MVAAATADVLFCSRFLFWYLKQQWENWLRKCSTFPFFFMLMSQQRVRTFFFYIQVESAFSDVQFTARIFLDCTFHNNLELRGKSDGFAIDEPPKGSVN